MEWGMTYLYLVLTFSIIYVLLILQFIIAELH